VKKLTLRIDFIYFTVVSADAVLYSDSPTFLLCRRINLGKAVQFAF
jgi:hypothetical protein